MSQPQTNVLVPSEQAQDEAYQLLHNAIYAPSLFSKLASDYGIHASTPAEKEAVLTMADELRAAHEEKRAAAAAAHSSDLVKAANDLVKHRSQNGTVPTTPVRELPAVKQAAARWAANPQIAHAALTVIAGLNADAAAAA